MATFKTPPVIVVDFETYGIEARPSYPPVPVSMSIKWPQDKKPRFYAWGHPNGENNCARHVAEKLLWDVWESNLPILGQNLKFDIDVAEIHFGLPRLPWSRYHDTLPLLFLHNPRAHSFQLKPAAEEYLGQPPDEQDAVRDWLIHHQPVAGVRITKSTFGKYIAYAPPEIVGPYADGDVQRTLDLFKFLYPTVCERGMKDAYDRERRLMPILLDMERVGVPVDLDRLETDVHEYQKCMAQLDTWLRKKLKVGESMNLDSGDQLAEALIHAGLADAHLLGITKTGKYQTTQDAFERAITNLQVRHAFIYRSRLSTCLHTFMEPWLFTAQTSGGLIYSQWNSTRTPHGTGSQGTRTGRLSSSPNFQNLPLEFSPLWSTELKGLPRQPIKNLRSLPFIRSYIVPFEGHVLLDRDFQQQELKVLAHYEDDVLLRAYTDNPQMDIHSFAQQMINNMLGTSFSRKPIKNVGFAICYGAGYGKLALMLESTVEQARQVKAAYLKVIPGIKRLFDDMKRREKNNEPIHTFGGREYHVEPPEVVNGQIRNYSYKMVNVLIQGSSADITKDALIRFHEWASLEWYCYLSVHDEILISAPMEEQRDAMQCLREAMEATQLDLPLLSDGKYSEENWASMKPYKE